LFKNFKIHKIGYYQFDLRNAVSSHWFIYGKKL
jgi:hypothetical protein